MISIKIKIKIIIVFGLKLRYPIIIIEIIRLYLNNRSSSWVNHWHFDNPSPNSLDISTVSGVLILHNDELILMKQH